LKDLEKMVNELRQKTGKSAFTISSLYGGLMCNLPTANPL